MAIRSAGPMLWAALLGGVLFVAAQSAALAHTAKYGDAEHRHDGYACVFAGVVGLDDDDALAGGDYQCISPSVSSDVTTIESSSAAPLAVASYRSRAPPFR
ncbi:MAG: hypothetical protein HKN14_03915 [Marinicaulis sp.]|nr:hypothetical protein [Marinicaulis sp.]NNE40047.1 hypothetical protein [Marinicaulis sp.]NNL88495.1 hypothetical protein [Marinicaulis sp.]